MSDARPHVSFSSLETLAKCGLMWDFRYNQGLKIPPGVQLVIGKGTHGAIDKDLSRKLEWGTLLPDDAIADYARDATRAEWEREPPKPDEDGAPADLGSAVDTAVALAELHHREVAPSIVPVAVERRFMLELPEFPFDIEGQVDVEEADHIRDVKTSGKSPPANAADVSDQLTLYDLEASVRGVPKRKVFLDYLVKTKTPKAVTLESYRTPEDHLRFLHKVELAAKVIQSGAFMPAPRGSWYCSPKWCGFWDVCPAGGRQVTTVGLIDPARLTSRLLERRP